MDILSYFNPFAEEETDWKSPLSPDKVLSQIQMSTSLWGFSIFNTGISRGFVQQDNRISLTTSLFTGVPLATRLNLEIDPSSTGSNIHVQIAHASRWGSIFIYAAFFVLSLYGLVTLPFAIIHHHISFLPLAIMIPLVARGLGWNDEKKLVQFAKKILAID